MPRARAGKKIQYTHWTYGSFKFEAISAGVAGVTLFSAIHEPETVLRFRGEWVAHLDSVATPGLATAATVGMILVPEGTGTTVLWSPVTDGDAPWMWWDVIHMAYEEYVVDVIHDTQMTSGRRVIDSKAMRIARNQEVQIVLENVTLGSADAVNVYGSGRCLVGK